MKTRIVMAAVMMTGAVFAQQAGRDQFMKQQAMAEMQRVSGQMDVLQNNIEELQQRVGALERKNGNDDLRALRAEVESLKATIADLKNQLAKQRGQIVNELSGKIAKMQPATPPPAPKPSKPAFSGTCSEYTVSAGDSLYLIAQAFKTSVSKIKEMNNLKSDALKVGQKLLVPEVK